MVRQWSLARPTFPSPFQPAFLSRAGGVLAVAVVGCSLLGCAEAAPAFFTVAEPVIHPVAVSQPALGARPPAPAVPTLPPAPTLPLVPTQVNTGDCVADRISIDYAPERLPFDEAYCRAGNPDDEAAYRVCLRNSALNDTAFFTDRCGDGTEYFLAVEGREHRLQRVGPPWAEVNLSGRFAGDGLELEVLPLQELGTDLPQDDPEVAESGAWRVQVTFRRGVAQRTFEATLTYGP